VLPLVNLSGDANQDYFADGITESLTTELSRLRGAFVIARNTAFTFKGRDVDAREIGKELGVRYILEGSVQRDQSVASAMSLADATDLSRAGIVIENDFNGDSVYQGSHLIRQKSVNPDGSYDVAYFDVIGKPYSSYESPYNSAGAHVATAKDEVDGSGDLTVYANGLTITTYRGGESARVGSDTFGLTPHQTETTRIENDKARETFVYDPGFGRDTIIGFLATASGHDHLEFSASMFCFSATTSQIADALALLTHFATGTTNTTITDIRGDALTLSGVTIGALQAHLADFKFT
jgi:hypothetical protein